MPVIKLSTTINAPVHRLFDLSRSIDAHMDSTYETNEKAIDGRTSGLIELGECVTWEAKHFGIKQRLKVEIIKFERPKTFTDQMVLGPFKSMKHVHRFEEKNGVTQMNDEFEFHAPLGFIGRLAEKLFLTNYMKSFLVERNRVLKNTAESDKWRKYLPS